FNDRSAYVPALDNGPARTRLAVADLHGERLAQRLAATPNSGGPDHALARLAGELRTLLSESRVPIGRLLAVSAGAPGVVDRDRGVVVALAPNLKGWSQVPMAKVLRRNLGA